MGMRCFSKIALALISLPALFSLFVLPCKAYSFSSYDIGGTTYFTGGVSGSAYDNGGTTYYNLNGKTYSSYDIGDTTYYSGNGLTGTSYEIGGTTYNNIGGIRFHSYDIGGTTYYSGDITGSAYTIGGTTYNRINPNTSSSTFSLSNLSPTYYSTRRSYYYSPYNSGYYLNLYSKVYEELQGTLPAVKTYGGQNGEPTFQTEEAYNMWKQVHDHPYETLSSGFDEGAKADVSAVGYAGLPNITSINNIGGGRVRVCWTLVQDAEKYYVFYGPSSKNYPYMTSVGGTTTCEEVGGFAVGSKYYSIQAQFSKSTINRGGNNDYYSEKGKEMSVVIQ